MITRFLFARDHFVPSKGRVKPAGLDPYQVQPAARLETSIYRVAGASAGHIWAICAAHVDKPNRIAKARGTCAASVVLEAGLTFDADGYPHPWHANIVGWPTQKHARKNYTQKIAAAMSLEVRTSRSVPAS